ncbi:energy transducer TonB [Desulfoluna spongiiphila]|uniref:energy transducer TonB n=1 Tax=Desulfoluna spongiiphila TaxID=419481 RepID=UPI001258F255|nr:energy transducer TonB [Desulfoluna spongiiphila]VVS95637.1 consensus disorder prediction [Desulfoluna spongiiphila]
MNRLTLSAFAAALLHAFFFLVPLPTASVAPPSAPTHGTTISVSMTVPSVQAPAPAKAVVKPIPKKTTPQKKKQVQPKKPVKKKKEKKKKQPKRVKPKVAKKKVPVQQPAQEIPRPAPPEVVEDPAPVPDETRAREAEEATVAKNTTQDAEETAEPASAPAMGGVQSDAQPTSVYAPEPRYPKAAIRRGYQGVVLLDILVNGDGHVEEVKLKKSSGHGVLDRSAVKGVKKWRFSASGADPIWITLPVRFELRGI